METFQANYTDIRDPRLAAARRSATSRAGAW